jgi:hypothetical protein
MEVMKKPMNFTEEDIQVLDIELKVGILGTVNDDGLPHLTMISSLRPYSEEGLVWGQFTEGLSKQYIRCNPKVGFLIMSLDKSIWRGKAAFTHTSRHGTEYDNFNELPMFRYNAYFGIHTVYYMDLVEFNGLEKLPMARVISAAVRTTAVRLLSPKNHPGSVLNPWVRTLLNKLDNLKFLGYVGADGYPVVLPVIQTQALNNRQVVFSTGAYREELESIPHGIPMAVFGLSFDMEDVLLRGTFLGTRRLRGFNCGVVDIEWVYNSMPPTPQQVYPPIPIEAVRKF